MKITVEIDEKLYQKITQNHEIVDLGPVASSGLGQWPTVGSVAVPREMLGFLDESAIILRVRPKQPRRWLVEEIAAGGHDGTIELSDKWDRSKPDAPLDAYVRIVREITVPDGEFAEVGEPKEYEKEPYACPTCYSEQKDHRGWKSLVGECPDLWHGDGTLPAHRDGGIATERRPASQPREKPLGR